MRVLGSVRSGATYATATGDAGDYDYEDRFEDRL